MPLGRAFLVPSVVVGLATLLTVACSNDYNPSTPTAPTAVGGAPGTSGAVSLAAKANAGKVDVCHVEDNGSYHRINVSGNALSAHLGHGDGVPGGAVPGGGFVFGAACEALADTDGDLIPDVDDPDALPPTVVIDRADGQPDGTIGSPLLTSPINFKVTFSEPVTGFTLTDVSTVGSTASITSITVSPTGPATEYNVAISASCSGIVKISIAAYAAVDNGGQANLPSSDGTDIDNSVQVGIPVSVFFNSTGRVSSFTVPCSGTYRLEAFGAKGGESTNGAGGFGASLRGDFNLVANDVLQIVVGGIGTSSSLVGAGGGGSFIYKSPSPTTFTNLLVAAGGGGGAGYNTAGGGGHLTTGAGNGGGSGSNGGGNCGGSGGGVGWGPPPATGNGGSGSGPFGSFANGGTKWSGGTSSSPNIPGGYGGGGAASCGGGGGGGYTGGNGGDNPVGGSGGSSYLDVSGANGVQMPAAQSGGGFVAITSL